MPSDRSPANHESTSVIIRRTPDDVWEYVSDLGRTPTWRTTVTSIDPPAELQVGERFTGTTRLLGRTWKWVMELTTVDVGSELGYVVVEGVVKPSVTYHVDPHPLGTRFTLTGELDRPGLAGRLLKPFAARALRRETADHLANLGRILESDAGTGEATET